MSRSKKKYRAPQIPPASSHHNGVSRPKLILIFIFIFNSIFKEGM
jgi:hypothetical protein